MITSLVGAISQVISGQQSQSWLLPVLVAVLAGGAGSQLPVDAWIRGGTFITVVVIVLVITVRRSPTRVNL
ncbi:hypothetical protein ABZ891_34585 [Streptomyces sp. NPDC047023]|uniref:hypothetical protein n=1 Tax=Streptomyces sp. NPDC047023 TaxID=3155139 RepID=UPI0034118DC7